MLQVTARDEAHCELSFSPNVSLIPTVRRFVGEFYEHVLKDAEITSRLVVASHELLENAVRYSVDGHSSIRITVTRSNGFVHVTIDTKNRTSAHHRDALVKLLDEMKASGDRLTYYRDAMRKTATRAEGSGLGLGRIHAESEMDVSSTVVDDVVTMRAEGRFAAKGGRS